MKTNFTFRTIRFIALTIVLAYPALNLNGQTSHTVAVTSYVFTPKELTITAGDTVIWKNQGGSHNVDGLQTIFPANAVSFGNNVGAGWTYKFVFNTPGTYNYQCDPHAAMGMTGMITVNPKSSETLTLTVNFTGMTPHVGETLWLAVIDQTTKMEIGRVKTTAAATFSLMVPGIEVGKSYFVDFWADHNKNGVYDAPPADHAWRMQLNNVTGNSVLSFAHNTNFTDIAWKNKLTVHFTGMTPHVGENLTLFLKQMDTGIYQDTVMVSPVPGATFDAVSYMIKPGLSYDIDFYADHNKNGKYDAPPTDHAWRIMLNNVKGDTIVNFAHNTNFTDIFSVTLAQILNGNSDKPLLYPNPASQYVELVVPRNYAAISMVNIYSITGALIEQKEFSGNSGTIRYDISHFRNGLYLMQITAGERKDVLKFLKQ